MQQNCLLTGSLMATSRSGIAVGQSPSVIIAAVARADSNPLLVGVGFAGVVERGRPVFKIAVLVEDAGKKQNWAMRAGGNPLAVAGEGVVSQ